MQKLNKIILLALFVWVALLVFMPKIELYYLLEKNLANQGVKINEKKIQEGPFSLHIDKMQVFVKGIDIATIDEADLMTLLVYSRATLKNVLVDPILKDNVPQKIDEVHLTHHLFAPTKIAIDMRGNWGKIEGQISLLDRKIHLDLLETNGTLPWQQQFKKGKKGMYYETSF